MSKRSKKKARATKVRIRKKKPYKMFDGFKDELGYVLIFSIVFCIAFFVSLARIGKKSIAIKNKEAIEKKLKTR